MKKRSAMCKYFRKDGYCAKGDYCEFSHDSEQSVLCRYVANNKSCPFGSSCGFRHHVESTNRNKCRPLRTLDNSGLELNVENNQDNTSVRVFPAPETDKSSYMSQSLLWGLDDAFDDGIYFYGAPSEAPRSENNRQQSCYAAVVKKSVGNGNQMTAESSHIKVSRPEKNVVCQYFMRGECRYGDRCRYEHVSIDAEVNSRSENEESLLMQEISDAKNMECGICMGNLDGRLGMLSHCNCIFCINCIREWRKSGSSIAKADQVR